MTVNHPGQRGKIGGKKNFTHIQYKHETWKQSNIHISVTYFSTWQESNTHVSWMLLSSTGR